MNDKRDSALINLILPAVSVPSAVTATAQGPLVVPGPQIPAREIALDEQVVFALLNAAKLAANTAYAPFSNFHVGAALVMQDDPTMRVFTGANVENSSYGGTICAERVALTTAAAAGYRRLRYLAVSVADALASPLADRSPCGICRQVIRQFCDPEAAEPSLIFVQDGSGQSLAEVFDIERLLPWGFRFDPQNGGAP